CPYKACIRRPVRSTLERPDAVQTPAAEQCTLRSVKVLTRQLIDVIEYQAMPDVEEGIAAIKTRVVGIGAVPIPARRACRRRGRVMPRRSIVDRVAPGVAGVR